jgi:hypothetical protein
VALFATEARAGYTIVQSKDCIGVGVPHPSLTCAFTTANTATNTIIAVGITGGIQAIGLTIADSQVNTYHSDVIESPGSGFATPGIVIWSAPNIHAGANTISINNNASNYSSVYIMEVSGTDAISAFDQGNGALSTTAGVHSLSSGNITTTSASEFIVSASEVMLNGPNTNPSSWTDLGGGTWTLLLNHNDTQDGATTAASHTATQIVAATGTYSNTMTANGVSTGAQSMVSAIASYTIHSGSGVSRHRGYVF